MHTTPRQPRSDPRPGPDADALVLIDGGVFRPDTLALRAGHAHRIVFRRQDTDACSDHVVFPTLARCVPLPTSEDVVVELPDLPPGSYPMTCRRGALFGRLVVRRGR